MAGRGVNIIVKVLGQGESGEMQLPVALHTPLEVLRVQLAQYTGIGVLDQMLILCDLSDPDRNKDVSLQGKVYK